MLEWKYVVVENLLILHCLSKYTFALLFFLFLLAGSLSLMDENIYHVRSGSTTFSFPVLVSSTVSFLFCSLSPPNLVVITQTWTIKVFNPSYMSYCPSLVWLFDTDMHMWLTHTNTHIHSNPPHSSPGCRPCPLVSLSLLTRKLTLTFPRHNSL